MKITRLLAIGVIAGSSWLGLQVGTGTAQIREQQPAEFPPASYKGKQYVDSNGCVFIRAGIDGDVAWVPRVSRDRKVICGFRPTLATEAAEAPAAAPTETTQTAAAPTTATRPATRRAAPAAAPAPKPSPRRAAPSVVRQTAPKPKRTPRVATAPKPIAPEQVRLLVKVPKGGLCPGASPQAQPYLRGTGRIRTSPSVGVLARSIKLTRRHRILGLPLGHRAVRMSVELVHDETGEVHKVDHTYDVELTAKKPGPGFEFYEPKKR